MTFFGQGRGGAFCALLNARRREPVGQPIAKPTEEERRVLGERRDSRRKEKIAKGKRSYQPK